MRYRWWPSSSTSRWFRPPPLVAPSHACYVCMRCILLLPTLVRRDPVVVSEPGEMLLVKESAEASEQFLCLLADLRLAGYVCMQSSLPLAALVRRDPAAILPKPAVVKESAEASKGSFGLLLAWLRCWPAIYVCGAACLWLLLYGVTLPSFPSRWRCFWFRSLPKLASNF